jgi:hypothetical protein
MKRIKWEKTETILVIEKTEKNFNFPKLKFERNMKIVLLRTNEMTSRSIKLGELKEMILKLKTPNIKKGRIEFLP